MSSPFGPAVDDLGGEPAVGQGVLDMVAVDQREEDVAVRARASRGLVLPQRIDQRVRDGRAAMCERLEAKA